MPEPPGGLYDAVSDPLEGWIGLAYALPRPHHCLPILQPWLRPFPAVKASTPVIVNAGKDANIVGLLGNIMGLYSISDYIRWLAITTPTP